MQKEQQLVDWCPWLKADGGFTGLKWIAAVVLSVYMDVSLSLWLHVTASVFVCFCVEDHIYTISECLPCRWTIRQADRFLRKESDGYRTAAGVKPAEIVQTVRTGGLFVSAWLVTDRTRDWVVPTILSSRSTLPLLPLAAAPKTRDSS